MLNNQPFVLHHLHVLPDTVQRKQQLARQVKAWWSHRMRLAFPSPSREYLLRCADCISSDSLSHRHHNQAMTFDDFLAVGPAAFSN